MMFDLSILICFVILPKKTQNHFFWKHCCRDYSMKKDYK